MMVGGRGTICSRIAETCVRLAKKVHVLWQSRIFFCYKLMCAIQKSCFHLSIFVDLVAVFNRIDDILQLVGSSVIITLKVNTMIFKVIF